MKYFVVSDVHSFMKPLLESLNKKGFDKNNKEHILCVCGDLFDRGCDSVELLKYVQDLGDRFIYIRGNHEDLLFQAMNEISANQPISNYHFSNGTMKTIAQFVDISEYDFLCGTLKAIGKKYVVQEMQPILDWINTKTVNYYTIGDSILTHGWVPCVCDDLNIYHARKHVTLAPLDWWDSTKDYDATDVWNEARWLNGMDAWQQGAKIEGKTIICGHWHCSWGWSHIRQKYKEFPQKTHEDFEKSFQPFIDDGIIAIDSCVAYSNKINCIVLDECGNLIE